MANEGCNTKMIRKQILKVQEHPRNDLLERENPQMSGPALTFNISYYPAFQKVRAIMEEFHVLLTPNKEHEKVFPNVPVIGFRIGKSLKDLLVKPTLPILNESGRCEPCGKKTCLVCDFISAATTFTTEACQETFKIQSAPSTWDSEKGLYLLKRKVCGEVPYIEKAKTKFRYRFNNYKNKQKAFRKGNQKVTQTLFHSHYCFNGHRGIEDWDFVIFEQFEKYVQLKEREASWQHRLKTFYPVGLNEKEEYLY